MLRAWLTEAKKLETGESTKEEYDDWRYKYPELDTHQIWAKVPSQELFDMLEKSKQPNNPAVPINLPQPIFGWSILLQIHSHIFRVWSFSLQGANSASCSSLQFSFGLCSRT